VPEPRRIDVLNIKRMRFPIDVILACIRWYTAYPLSYRYLEEMMQEHGVSVDHSSINRWAICFLPLVEKMARNTSARSGAAGAWMRPTSKSNEWHDYSGNWLRSYGNENWEFDAGGLMTNRYASINDKPILASERKYHWPLGRCPDDHPGLSELGL
jgi:hypothetical protein